MVNVRLHPDAESAAATGQAARFNVLLTEDRPREGEYWTRQLPRLLAPQGVQAFVARSGREAVKVAECNEIHAAVIDLATPVAEGDAPSGSVDPSQLWLLELFRRLPSRPPTIVVHGNFYSQAKLDRILSKALRLGAFSVMSKPVNLEQLLRVFQRMVDRRYAGSWPATFNRPFDS